MIGVTFPILATHPVGDGLPNKGSMYYELSDGATYKVSPSGTITYIWQKETPQWFLTAAGDKVMNNNTGGTNTLNVNLVPPSDGEYEVDLFFYSNCNVVNTNQIIEVTFDGNDIFTDTDEVLSMEHKDSAGNYRATGSTTKFPTQTYFNVGTLVGGQTYQMVIRPTAESNTNTAIWNVRVLFKRLS